jgi:hypothetical protein
MTSLKTLQTFPFVKVDPKTKAAFCVDGRKGEVGKEKYGPYPQMLGGSLGFAVLNWLLKQPNETLSVNLEIIFNRLIEKDYPLGIHTSAHAHPDQGKSDCGFADNLGKIFQTFKEKGDEIWHILNSSVPSLNQSLWFQIVEMINRLGLSNIPNGQNLISWGVRSGAVLQTLVGGHKEEAAIVNLKPNTTLDVDNNQDHQAFNLDLWLVEQVAQDLGWEVERAKLLTLGLYVATEMVLVEQKGKPRLPVLLRE